MRNILIVTIALLVAGLIVLQQSAGVPPAQLANIFVQWPVEQKIVVIAVGVVLAFTSIVAIWQSDKLNQQSRAIATLQDRMSGVRDQLAKAEQEQNGADAALRYLVGSDPVVLIDDMQQRLARSEAAATLQQSQNEAIDLQSRIDEIVQRQQGLRARLGSISEKRRNIEPMLGQIKERQALIERSLSDIEKDENGKNLDARIKDAESFVIRGQNRLGSLDTLFEGLGDLNRQLEALDSRIAPLKHADAGIKQRLADVAALCGKIDAAFSDLERDGNATIQDRVDRLRKNRQEIEGRLSALTENFNSLEAIRGDIGSYFEQMSIALDKHSSRAELAEADLNRLKSLSLAAEGPKNAIQRNAS